LNEMLHEQEQQTEAKCDFTEWQRRVARRYQERFGNRHRRQRCFKGAYSYGSRFGEEEGTNPEQLIAAAQAACFTMALANILATAGHAPESVRTNARVQLRIVNGAPTLTRLDLDTEGHVPGIDEQQFQRYADEAKAACPVARALAGIPEMVLTAKLTVGV
jgi:lipoyl-dependent peroxiredoxin